jgi:hypothetical protein
VRRVAVTALVMAAAEAYLALRYAALGALFHYWLHGLTGAAAGLALVPAERLLRPTRHRHLTVLAAAATGRLFFALPDVLFLAADLPHATWMDVFGGHIAVHFVPAPLAVAFAVFALGVVAAALAVSDRARDGAAVATLAVVVLGAAFALRAPLPRTLDEVREHPGVALRCTLPGERAAQATGSTSQAS